MKKYVLTFLATATPFLMMDGVWLTLANERLYRHYIGPILMDGFRVAPAVAFYCLYVAGIIVFAIEPARLNRSVATAATKGALLGIVAYGTYDLTNQATLLTRSSIVTVADMIWGAIVSATAASVGYVATRRLR